MIVKLNALLSISILKPTLSGEKPRDKEDFIQEDI